ncbi:hypothetical protein G7046_g9297 [Stylonectria norvegica]|nr:hypothetical protein G7046_g9297 [Stylonectria norvegica]
MSSLKQILLLGLIPFTLASPVKRQTGFSGSTQNGLSGDCKAVTALAEKVRAEKLAVQGVEYPADVAGIIAGGDSNGSKKMASLVEETFKKCPDTKVVISGYSQGAMLVHNAAKLLSADLTGKIAAAVTFGDPYKSQEVKGVSADRTKIICHADDNVCQGGAMILPSHLTYGSQNAGEAASFVASKI